MALCRGGGLSVVASVTHVHACTDLELSDREPLIGLVEFMGCLSMGDDTWVAFSFFVYFLFLCSLTLLDGSLRKYSVLGKHLCRWFA